MTDKYASAFAPRDPSELARDAARAATASVQSSLYGRLKKAFGLSNAGTIAWMLLHAADASHRSHDEALAALESRTRRELSELWNASEGAVRAAKTGEARAIAVAVHGVVESVVARERAALGIVGS